MTAAVNGAGAQNRLAFHQRMPSLCAQFQEPGQTRVHIPYSTRDLADLWQLSPGTVQSNIKKMVENGAVLERGRGWLILDATHPLCRPRLSVVREVPHRPSEATPPLTFEPNDDYAHGEVDSPPADDPVASKVIDALVAAAQANTSPALIEQLTAAALTLYTTNRKDGGANPSAFSTAQTPDDRAKTRDERAVTRGDARRLRGRSNTHNARGLENSNPTPRSEITTAQTSREPETVPPELAETLRPSESVEIQRILTEGKEKQWSHPEARTPAWMRSGWVASRWTAEDVEALKVFWAKYFDETISWRTTTTLKSWSVEVAKTAVRLMAEKGDTKRPGARMAIAAAWGFHEFFPLHDEIATASGSGTSTSSRTDRIVELAASMRRIAPLREDFADSRAIDLERLPETHRDPTRWATFDKTVALFDWIAVAVHLGVMETQDFGDDVRCPWSESEFDEHLAFVAEVVGP